MTTEPNRILDVFDASDLIGLKVRILKSAIDTTEESGDNTITIPDIEQATKTAVIARCLMQGHLAGTEIRAIRKIAGFSMSALAFLMDTYESSTTIAHWENENIPMSVYADKIFRLVICEHLSPEVYGITYNAGILLCTSVGDLRRVFPGYETPYIDLVYRHGRHPKTDGLISIWTQQNAG